MSDQPSEEALQEVIALIEKLVTTPPLISEEELGETLERLTSLVPHPEPAEVFFRADEYVSVREMALEMFSYQPIVAGYTP